MALHSRKQIQELLNMTRSALGVYIQRKKVELTDGMIDDTIPKNQEFLKKHLEKVTASSPSDKKAVPPVPGPGSVEIPPQFRNDHAQKSITELERALKEAELAKKQVDTQIALLKEEKLRGVVIPTDIVKVVFAQHFKSITSSFHQAADNLIVNIQKKKDLNREEVAQIRGELIELINIAVNQSIDESKKNLKNIVAEYSDKKGIGERE